MPWIATTTLPGGSFGVTSKMFWMPPTETFPLTAANLHEVPYPTTIAGLETRPSWANYRGRLYGAGGWNDNIVFDEHLRVSRLGIDPPDVVPTVALVAGPGVTANVICYLTYYDEDTGEESGLSAESTTLAAANQQIQWTALPAPLDPRVTHIGFWRSVDGGLPRLVMRRQLGVFTLTEAIDLGDLGEAFTDVYERFPRCKLNAIFHERQVLAGDDEHADTLYLSLLNLPERWGGLTLRTKDGDPIIGLLPVRDRLFVFSPFRTFVVDGWTEDDLELKPIQPEVGCLAHHANTIIHDFAWIPTHLGLYVSDGAGWFYCSDDIKTKWTTEYGLHRDEYEDSFCAHDPILHQYQLHVGGHSDIPANTEAWWAGDYQTVIPIEGGNLGQPRWSYKTRTRHDTCAATLSLPGSRRKELFVGSSDGFIRRENNTENAGKLDDDGDDYNKRMVWRHGVDFFEDVGGDARMGKRFTDLDVFLESETNGWTLECRAGDEWAERLFLPTYTKTEPVGAAAVPPFALAVDKTQWPFKPTNLVGRGLVVGGYVQSPDVVYYRGYQVCWMPGLATRGAKTENEDPG